MKISKQLLKEIIREEYKTPGARKSYILAREAIDILYDIVKSLKPVAIQGVEQDYLKYRALSDKFKFQIDAFRDLGPYTPFGLSVLGALDFMRQWADLYSQPEREENYALSNNFNIVLNYAARNFNRRGFGQLRLPNMIQHLISNQDETQPFAME